MIKTDLTLTRSNLIEGLNNPVNDFGNQLSKEAIANIKFGYHQDTQKLLNREGSYSNFTKRFVVVCSFLREECDEGFLNTFIYDQQLTVVSVPELFIFKRGENTEENDNNDYGFLNLEAILLDYFRATTGAEGIQVMEI